MEQLVFAKSWKEYFAEFGLKSFGDFFEYAGGTKIGENERRNVYRLTFGKGNDSKVLYIKRFCYSHLKDILAAWHNFGRPVSQAQVEWSNANLLLQNDIDTYKPVCMGERTMCRIERQSFLITEELKSTCLMDFVILKWDALQRETQDRIIVAMARLARNAHQANISLQDLFLWHLFIYEDSLEDDCRLSVIDLHRMLRNVRNPRKKAEDTGALYWSMTSEYFDEAHKDLLIHTYAGNDGWAGDKETVRSHICKRAAVLANRRNIWNHYAKARRGLGLD
jgi:hypothetical protein